MKTNAPRTAILVVTAAAGLLVVNSWAYTRLLSSWSAVREARIAELESTRLVARVRELREQPARIASHDVQAGELVRQIEQAAASAQIAKESLLSITPQSPRRLGDTDLLERSADVIVRQVTLGQLVSFLCRVAEGGSPLYCRSVRFSAPRAEAPAAGAPATPTRLWTAEVSVAYRVFAPRERQKPRSS